QSLARNRPSTPHMCETGTPRPHPAKYVPRDASSTVLYTTLAGSLETFLARARASEQQSRFDDRIDVGSFDASETPGCISRSGITLHAAVAVPAHDRGRPLVPATGGVGRGPSRQPFL